MKAYILVLFLTLVGCATSPALITPIPNPPIELMVQPAELKPLPKEPLVLSNLVDSVVDNYVTANITRIQLIELQSWIRQIVEVSKTKDKQ